ncbi:hypothetical protein CMUS01_14500 [Colletotrichum musicola]|uniref:Uncharacterized protein n=1 Tax=Colletotrichum musicola TaxID=2175873 RepID=A0A8H6J4F6_9PEZI|nr:hypothetical protein CMUS01_14500 [Colletotrichum musicola]
MKKQKIRLSDVHRHPPQPRAQKDKTAEGDEIINALYTACRRDKPPSLRRVREQPIVNLHSRAPRI